MSNPFKRLGCDVPLNQIIGVTRASAWDHNVGVWVKGKGGNGYPPYHLQLKTYPHDEHLQWDRDYIELRDFLELSQAMRGES